VTRRRLGAALLAGAALIGYGAVRTGAGAVAPGTAAGPGPAGRHHFVAPGGSAADSGTRERPWDLATALSGAGDRIAPGDTVWLLGGTYRGRFRTELRGEAGAPIVFRQLPGTRATIDGTLRADGAHLVFWGFEIMQADPLADDTYGLQANASYSRYVNLVIHDVGTQGVSFWNPGVDSELYGCIVYNNGSHENLDHGVYVHNEEGTKRLRDNVFFNNYARGIQVYASRRNPGVRGVRVEGNVAFNNGTIAERSTRVNLLLSAPVPTDDVAGIDNLLYYSGSEGINIRVGNYTAASNRRLELVGNYAAGGAIGLQMDHAWDRAVVRGNTFLGSGTVVRTGGADLGARYDWRDNRYGRDPAARAWRHDSVTGDLAWWRAASGLGARDSAWSGVPAAVHVVVRPNLYEPGRATVVVFNWGDAASVTVEVAGVLAPGDSFAVRNVQDLFGPPVAAGTYTGAPIAIPMAGVDPPAPIGRATPRAAPRTGPRFDVFILTRGR
jgi:hypothetical protein